jgi:hypothetical protein
MSTGTANDGLTPSTPETKLAKLESVETQIQRQVIAAIFAEHPGLEGSYSLKTPGGLDVFFNDLDVFFDEPHTSPPEANPVLDELITSTLIALRDDSELPFDEATKVLPFLSQVMVDELVKISGHKEEVKNLSDTELNVWIYKNVVQPKLAEHLNGKALAAWINADIEQGHGFGNYAFAKLDHILTSMRGSAEHRLRAAAEVKGACAHTQASANQQVD